MGGSARRRSASRRAGHRQPWFRPLRRHGDSELRREVDLAIDDLAAAGRRDERGWELTVDLAAGTAALLVLDVVVLEGRVAREALEAVIRRIRLLGGRVHAVLPDATTT